ncbi:tetratricopeptide repeat protein [Anthocerotibacter panamensis]|uniref:tetratricopeptide repeat protein n=1 Tax=Anthocerotibacter panamensis TaxID=2857077 RepID=UPI001C40891A|nr:tetratricopeptide repeat protein [Anthocerotibacter panamensis]
MPANPLPPEACSALGRWVADWLMRHDHNLNWLAKQSKKRYSVVQGALKKGVTPKAVTVEALATALGESPATLWKLVYQDKVEPEQQTEPRVSAAYESSATYRVDAVLSADYFIQEPADLALLAEVLTQRGRALRGLGQPARAQTEWLKALELAQKAGLSVLESQILGHLGDAHAQQGHYVQAQAYYKRALSMTERLLQTGADPQRVRPGLGWGFVGLGASQLHLGRLDQASAYLERALAVGQAVHSEDLLSAVYGHKGQIAEIWGNWSTAIAYYQQALEANADRGRWFLRYLGHCYLQTQQYTAAKRTLQQALVWAYSDDNAPVQAQVLFLLGWCEALTDDLEQAIHYYQLSCRVIPNPNAYLAWARIVRTSNTALSLARSGFDLLVQTADLDLLWDYTPGWLTLYEFFGDEVIAPARCWVMRLVGSFPSTFNFWNTPERQQLLHLTAETPPR